MTGAVRAYRERHAARPSGITRRSVGARALGLTLALFVLVAVPKVYEVFPAVAVLPWVKLTGVPLVIAAAIALDRRAIMMLLRTRTAQWMMVLVVMILLSVPGSLWPWYSVHFLTTELWKLVLIFVVLSAAALDRRIRRLAILAYVIGAAVVAVRVAMGGAQTAEWSVINGTQVLMGRAFAGATFDPNETALMLLAAVPFTVALGQLRGQQRLVWWGGAAVFLVATIRTGSRGGFLAMCAVGLWYLWRAPRGRRGTALVLLAGGIAVFVAVASGDARERLLSTFSPQEDYNFTAQEGRVAVWKRGLGYMASHPLLGVGVSCFPIAEGVLSGKQNVGYGIKYSAAHNSLLEVGAETGVIGLVAFVGIMISCLVGVVRVRRTATRGLRHDPHAVEDRELAVAVEGSLVVLIVAGSFLSFAYTTVTYFLFAMAAAVQLGAKRGVVVSDAQGAVAGLGNLQQGVPAPALRRRRQTGGR